MTTAALPLVAYYGDDFTGSADVMEVMQWAGLRTVLFLQPPTTTELARYAGLRAYGVAGHSRTMSPEEMNAELPPIFAGLRASGAKIIHYKVCSTGDSSATIGSIGRALELGRVVFGEQPVPVLIAAPPLGRYQAFGNLFARSGLDSEVTRLDRHPTMRQHPITPMTEADLRLHLGKQTDLPISLVDLPRLASLNAAEFAETAQRGGAILCDACTTDDLRRIGGLLWELAQRGEPLLVIGSSGVEYALAEYWRNAGLLESLGARSEMAPPGFAPTEQLLVLTGSCSPVNARQIAWAEEQGFETVAIEPCKLAEESLCGAEVARVCQLALHHLRAGKNVILHTSRGPTDPRVAATIKALRRRDFTDMQIKLHSGRVLGPCLGRILVEVLAAHPLPRIGVAGGDTSGYVARQLGITALEALAPVAPGSPLCRATTCNALDGLEVIFKGGQVGKDNVWGTLLRGTLAA
ncbi:MAG: four-carbon acid sugar kinase family protein [Pirellulales bacterium]|nr:four-carbon acid sugar kinase family protein [Pirellulales bacterium]